MIANPWSLLPQSGNNFILPIDQIVVSNHNFKSDDNYRFHSELIPEPFIGNKSAPIVALNANPFKFLNLPSQQYSCQLVKMAIDREAFIILMRSKNVWFDLVPRLNDYKNLIIMNNPQQTYFSPGNMPRYNEVDEIISRSI